MAGKILDESGGAARLNEVADFDCSAGGYGGVPGFGSEGVFWGRGTAREFGVPETGDFAGGVELHLPGADGTGGCIFQEKAHLSTGSPITNELLSDGKPPGGGSWSGAGSGRWAC